MSNVLWYTRFRPNKTASKKFKRDFENDVVKKTPSADVNGGIVSIEEGTLLDFKEQLENPQGYVVCFGTYDDEAFGSPVAFTTAKKVKGNESIIARTNEFFSFREGQSGIGIVDHDPSEYGKTLRWRELLKILIEIDPQIAKAEYVVRGSLSAGVHKTGEKPKDGGGFHIYFNISDMSDVKRYFDTIGQHLWLKGYGFIQVAGDGSLHERCPIDLCMYQPTRIDFIDHPIIEGEGLEFTPPTVRYKAGLPIDTSKLEKITGSQKIEIVKLVSKAKALMKDEAKQKRAEYLEAIDKILEGQGLPADERARRIADYSVGSEDLAPGTLLQFANGVDISVGELLERHEEFEGLPLVDPRNLRGHYPDDSARFFFNEEFNYPIIRSWGHNGKVFRLVSYEKAEAKEEFEKKVYGGVEETLETMKSDDSVWRSAEFLDELMNLEELDGAEYDRVEKKLKALGVGKVKLDDALRKRKAALRKEKGLNQNGGYNITESEVAKNISDRLFGTICYDNKGKDFYMYNEGLWSVVSDELLKRAIDEELYIDFPMGFGKVFLNNVKDLLKHEMLFRGWENEKHLLPFTNGVLDTKTMILSDHSFENWFNWQLPYAYDVDAKIDVVEKWLNESCLDNSEKVKTIRAFFKMALLGGELQKFLELIGPGGSGKSTLTRLLINFVGKRNIATTDLGNLEKSQFESAKIYGKRLVLISDSKKFGGEVSILKQMTGGDPIRLEKKGIQQTGADDFIYGGVVAIVANEAIQSSDYTSGLSRRRLPVTFDRQVTDTDKAKWESLGGIESVMIKELPGLLNWVLEMNESEVRKAICGINGVLVLSEREHLITTNKQAQWIHENLSLNPKSFLSVWVSMRKKDSSETIEACKDKLYPNYENWCDEQGLRPIAVKSFSENILDICKRLGLDACKVVTRSGAYIRGFEIRDRDKKGLCSPITGKVFMEEPKELSNVISLTKAKGKKSKY